MRIMYLHAGCSCHKHEAQKELEPLCHHDLALRRVESDVRLSTVVSSSDVSAQVAQTRHALLVQDSWTPLWWWKGELAHTLWSLRTWSPCSSDLSIWWLRAGGGRNCRVPTAAWYSNLWTCHSSSWICASWHSSWWNVASDCCTFTQSSWFFCCSAASSPCAPLHMWAC